MRSTLNIMTFFKDFSGQGSFLKILHRTQSAYESPPIGKASLAYLKGTSFYFRKGCSFGAKKTLFPVWYGSENIILKHVFVQELHARLSSIKS